MKDLKEKARKLGRSDRVMSRKYYHSMVRCPDCNALVGSSATQCWRCGEKLKRERE